MSTRIARDSGALLSATDSPVHTGHASSLSSRAARAAGALLGPERADEHDHRDHHDGREREPRHPPLASSADAPGSRDLEPRLELGHA